MFSPGYHYNDFLATHVLGHMMYVYTFLIPTNQKRAEQAN